MLGYFVPFSYCTYQILPSRILRQVDLHLQISPLSFVDGLQEHAVVRNNM